MAFKFGLQGFQCILQGRRVGKGVVTGLAGVNVTQCLVMAKTYGGTHRDSWNCQVLQNGRERYVEKWADSQGC
jgi:hypothetical protein